MPRTGRGGRRTGSPGTAYANRTDLNAAKPSGYGQKAAAEAALRAIPLPAQDRSPSPTRAPAPPPPVPGSSPFAGASARPGEPLTAGLPMGAGPGPGPYAPTFDAVTETLRAVLARSGNDAVAELLEAIESGSA